MTEDVKDSNTAEAPRTKVCSKCKVEKDVGEFSPQKNGLMGRTSKCRQCKAEYARTNRGVERDRFRRWYEQNADRVKANAIRWKESNPEKALEAKRKWAKNNPTYYVDRSKRQVDSLSVNYVKKLLKADKDLQLQEVPQELIELKRKQLKNTRVVRTIKRSIKKMDEILTKKENDDE